ncbi:BNR repeat-containing protein [Mucilaginibacter sp. SP1R1]|uniref:BNR repeat-containing protein n=1 Tax=Mucilaginibacter sp. SP1R1 TaxID=2723091 RepID=UPI00160771AD|nr:BNR repeat-containing protein [Mucilaginibacter sp. SP1R1]MBB6148932.1 hypothetical protein [Mucilaginibacter sp. SP1R1]
MKSRNLFYTQQSLKSICLIFLFFTCLLAAKAQSPVQAIKVADGWAGNSVNAVVFRKNSLVTFKDTQYIAFYNQQQKVVLGKRSIHNDNWELKETPLSGDVTDAHKSISIIVDGDGFLHVSWGHHDNALNYCHGVKPGSLEMTKKIPMTGVDEKRVTYPEFYKLSGGDLLFLYRNGQSGMGNLMINKYSVKTKKWIQLQRGVINGEGKRSAYTQTCVDNKGVIHLSWVWRESPDVASNHDMCYARSVDGGVTWEKSTGKKYTLPITAATAEYVCKIPAGSELINQTSMVADNKGNPCIATYWREAGQTVPQYHLIYFDGKKWSVQNLKLFKNAFSLSGAGTKHIPISRPQIITWQAHHALSAALIFRGAERDSKVSVAINQHLGVDQWQVVDLTTESVGDWEPSYDTELWTNKGLLNVFVEKVQQVDSEGKADLQQQPVTVLQVDIKNYPKPK